MIDLRSDTVTHPTPAMRRAMMDAELGDDVFGDDPTVHRLEALAADILNKEAGLFLCSGTMSNLAAIMTHCARGDEYIVGQNAHTYRYEGGGAAVLGSVQPQPLENADDGTIPVDKITAAIKPDQIVFARTRLICLENTIAGKALPSDYVQQVARVANDHSLAMHLDGARLFNASVATGTTPAELAAPFDTVSICLSKGLGAPVGSILAGPRDFIEEARRWRKVLGGGWRQAGLLAACGIVALTQGIDRLSTDHENASLLASGLRDLGFLVDGPHTNQLFLQLSPLQAETIASFMAARNIKLFARGTTLRLVTHHEVHTDHVATVLASFAEFARKA